MIRKVYTRLFLGIQHLLALTTEIFWLQSLRDAALVPHSNSPHSLENLSFRYGKLDRRPAGAQRPERAHPPERAQDTAQTKEYRTAQTKQSRRLSHRGARWQYPIRLTRGFYEICNKFGESRYFPACGLVGFHLGWYNQLVHNPSDEHKEADYKRQPE